MQSNFEPKPSGKGKFYIHLNNWAEFLSWFSSGVALSFIGQLVPQLLLLYPLAVALTLAYFISSLHTNKTANILRITAIVLSCVGFWNLLWLYRDTTLSAVAVIAILAVFGGVFVWLKK